MTQLLNNSNVKAQLSNDCAIQTAEQSADLIYHMHVPCNASQRNAYICDLQIVDCITRDLYLDSCITEAFLNMWTHVHPGCYIQMQVTSFHQVDHPLGVTASNPIGVTIPVLTIREQ